MTLLLITELVSNNYAAILWKELKDTHSVVMYMQLQLH